MNRSNELRIRNLLTIILPIMLGLGIGIVLPPLAQAQGQVIRRESRETASLGATRAKHINLNVPAADIQVDTDADNSNTDNLCSLREAILNANQDADLSGGDCQPGSGDDTITFNSNYTITLGSSLPQITDSLTIEGNGPGNTIVQASTCNPVTQPGGCTPADWRVFTVTGTTSILKDMTVRFGDCQTGGGCLISDEDGGNIYAEYSDLTLDGVHVQSGFADNEGGGLSSLYGDLTIQNNSLIGGEEAGNRANDADGGGIIFLYGGSLLVDSSRVAYNYADGYSGGIHFEYSLSAIVRNGSSIDHNTAEPISGDYGGGMYVHGLSGNCQLSVDSSDLSDNTAGSDGGGLWTSCKTVIAGSTISGNLTTDEAGGGIFNHSTGILTVTNSTLSGNGAPSGQGGGIYNEGGAAVFNSTISASSAITGAGIYDEGTGLILKNTILANSLSGEDCFTSAPLAADVNNLIENNSGCGTPVSSDDPKLGPLADNGGRTLTHALLPGSPALGTGDSVTCAASPVDNVDQRGVVRPQGAGCDIGAYEYILNFPPFNYFPIIIK